MVLFRTDSDLEDCHSSRRKALDYLTLLLLCALNGPRSSYLHVFPLYPREWELSLNPPQSPFHNNHTLPTVCGEMDEDTPRLPTLPANPDSNAAANDANISDDAKALKAEDHVEHPNNAIAANFSTISDSSPKPQRRRNKPSLSCETCTVSRSYNIFPLLFLILPSLFTKVKNTSRILKG